VQPPAAAAPPTPSSTSMSLPMAFVQDFFRILQQQPIRLPLSDLVTPPQGVWMSPQPTPQQLYASTDGVPKRL
jgi:hypothetical protein